MSPRRGDPQTGRNLGPDKVIRRRTPEEEHARAVDTALARLRAAVGDTYVGDPWRFAHAPAIVLDPSHVLAGSAELLAATRARLGGIAVHVTALPADLRPAAVIIPILEEGPHARR